ncbi:MAG TPA: FGGY family carbohydrate kinase, partial [Gemmatimonadales bacterium]
MKSVLAIDEGTTGARALVIADDGRVLGRGYREIPQHFPRPGWVEHDPEDLWAASLDACREALAQAKTKPLAIGITNQRETVCVWDRKTGKPLHRAIVWQDRRTADRCAALEGTPEGKAIKERTGLVLDPYFSGTKIEWLMQQVPGVRGQVSGGDAVFGTVDSWILYRLTGGKTFATDHTNASRTLLYNIRDLAWDDG